MWIDEKQCYSLLLMYVIDDTFWLVGDESQNCFNLEKNLHFIFLNEMIFLFPRSAELF